MPAKSEKQFKYMQLVASGKIKNSSLSKEIAREFLMYGSPKKEYKKKDEEKEREKNKKALKQISSSYK